MSQPTAPPVPPNAVKPAILTVDDDPVVSQAVTRDLRARYGAEYRVVRATSGAQAAEVLAELALRDQPVALIASDQRMPGMSGIELLDRARTLAPDAKLVLLTAYADTAVAIRAINDIGLDHYLLKPWDPPEEHLYPVVDDLLADWRRAHPDTTAVVRVVGHRWSERSHELKTFLGRNHVPYAWLDVERSDEGRRLLAVAGAEVAEMPLVLVPGGTAMRSPTTVDLAAALGLRTSAAQPLYDLCIVGAGPAGLAAAVYAASEGLRTVVVEREAPGGQAGQSAAIENYLGFPKGLSGAELTHRAVAQVARFGAETVLAREVAGLQRRGSVHAVLLGAGAVGAGAAGAGGGASAAGASHGEAAPGDAIEARAVVVATGVSYRRLAAPGVDAYTGRGVYYGASPSEAGQCAGEDVYVVGAANSAGQAALNLARYARRVVLVVRGDSVRDSMSRYLVDRIAATPNVDVRLRSEVVAGSGGAGVGGHLESVTIADRADGSTELVPTSWLFVFIGASPRTDWLGDAVVRDEAGFVVTGGDLVRGSGGSPWPVASRPPMPLETSVPGVFAAGDVRLDSMKRVASAVGEGAMAVHLVHRYLATV